MLDAVIDKTCICRDGTACDCPFCHMIDTCGGGEKTVYSPLEGVTVIYNDFFAAKGLAELTYTARMLSIDHCQKGRAQWEHTDGSLSYLGEGDVQISANLDHTGVFGSPACRYYGITINIFIDQAVESLRRSFPPFALDLDALWLSFLVRRDYFLTRAEKRVQGVFADLHENRISITNDYLRLKIMDLLIALEAIVSANCQAEKPYFKRSHVEKVRQVRDYLCENPSHRPTAERLARQFELPQATLRQCFSAMYGLSIIFEITSEPKTRP